MGGREKWDHEDDFVRDAFGEGGGEMMWKMMDGEWKEELLGCGDE